MFYRFLSILLFIFINVSAAVAVDEMRQYVNSDCLGVTGDGTSNECASGPGQPGAFDFMFALEAQNLNLVSLDKNLTVIVSGGISDSISVVWDGWVTDANHRILITTAADQKHNGTYPIEFDSDTRGTYHVGSNGSGTLWTILDDYITIDGIPFSTLKIDGGAQRAVSLGGSHSVFRNNIVHRKKTENLLTYSEQFDNASWTKTRATISPDAINAPDGNATADLMVEDVSVATNSLLRKDITLVNGTQYAYRIFAKYKERNIGLIIADTGVLGLTLYADLRDCTVFSVSESTGTFDSYSVSPVEDEEGWCRIEAVYTPGVGAGVTQHYAMMVDDTGSQTYDGDGTSGVYIWGAQIARTGIDDGSYKATTASALTYAQGSAAWGIHLAGDVNTTINNVSIYNNLATNYVYNLVAYLGTTGNHNIHNNTFVGSDATNMYMGIGAGGHAEVYNNIAISASAGDYSVSGATGTLNTKANITEDATSPDGASFQNIIPIFKDDAYRLANEDIFAKDGGEPVAIVNNDFENDGRKFSENLFTYSEEFDNAAWTSNASVTANATTAPDGTETADAFIEHVSVSTNFWLKQNATLAAGTRYVFTVRAKQKDSRHVNLTVFAPAILHIELNANLATSGVFGTDEYTGSIDSYAVTDIGNGWRELDLTFTGPAGIGETQFYVKNLDASGDQNYNGDGTSGVYVWGAQLQNYKSTGIYVPTQSEPVLTAGNSLNENLLRYPEQLDNPVWGPARVTVDANDETAPDESSTADKIIEDTSNNTHYIVDTYASVISGDVYRMSGYFKTAGRDLRIYNVITAGSAFFADIDLTTGAVSNIFGASSVTSEDVGDGWWRVNMLFTASSSNTLGTNIYVMDGGNNSYLGDGTSGIYAWGMQLQRANADGVYTRLDIENLLRYSEELDNPVWTKLEATVTADATTAPDGKATADKVIPSTFFGSHAVEQTVSVANGKIYTLSGYFKADEYDIALLQSTYTGGGYAYFNLDTLAITAVGATTQFYDVGDGWFFCSITSAATASGSGLARAVVSNTAGVFAGDGSSGGYVWGLQLKNNTAQETYIKTEEYPVRLNFLQSFDIGWDEILSTQVYYPGTPIRRKCNDC